MSAPAEPFISHELPGDISRKPRSRSALWRNPGVIFGVAVLLIILILAIGAAHLAGVDPILLRPRFRLRSPSVTAWLGCFRLTSRHSASSYGARSRSSPGY